MRWFVLASGPSLQPEEIELIRQEREADRCRVIAVNSTCFGLPWVDAIYGWDLMWWEKYHNHSDPKKRIPEGPARISARPNLQQFGVKWLEWRNTGNVTQELGASGNSSGHHAIGYAYLQGATEIIVIGLDCRHHEGKAHHHEDHPAPLGNAKNAHNWLLPARKMAEALKRKGVRIVNCGRYQAEGMGMERMSLEAFLNEAKAA